MANNLSQLIPDLYEAIDTVSRELVGFIPSVTLDASADRAALNQAIRIPITAASSAEDVTPGQLPPDDGDQTVTNNVLSITKSYGINHCRFHSWCPPEAAFEAADELGVYFQAELPKNSSSEFEQV